MPYSILPVLTKIITLLLIPCSIYSQAHKRSPDHIFAENSADNNLYVGIDNYVTLACDHDTSAVDKYLSLSSGQIFKEGNRYLIIPTRAGFLNIKTHFVLLSSGDTIIHDVDRLAVLNVPQPVIFLNEKRIKDIKSISRYALMSSNGFELFFSDDILDASTWYSIEQVSMSYEYGGNAFNYTNSGPLFSDEMKHHMENIFPGKEVIFRIRIKSPENIAKDIPLFKVQVY